MRDMLRMRIDVRFAVTAWGVREKIASAEIEDDGK
jgi:hypothetical protein